ncbi:MAG: ribonuclease protein component, partial [Actinomycetota bacterium]|nr:ribonuclease protein component [Actinomycetota bacterium]
LPAEQPSAGKDPRVPVADAYPRRPRHSRRAAHQGSLAALGLTSVLPSAARLRRRDEFVATLRAGRRRTGGLRPGLIVAHVAMAPVDAPAGLETRAGLVVSRAVGGAVVRNAVKRRLRHLLASRLTALPAGSRVVVRALPAAAAATSAQLGAALDDGLRLAPGEAR